MSKLRRIRTPELERLEGYLSAAQHVFFRGELDVTLESALFEITMPDISDEEVVRAAYNDLNPIEDRAELSLDEMVTVVEETLSITKAYWKKDSARELVENNLRKGFWEHLNACFDLASAQIVELGPNVPWVNMDRSFTFILYAPDRSKCLLLVGNMSD